MSLVRYPSAIVVVSVRLVVNIGNGISDEEGAEESVGLEIEMIAVDLAIALADAREDIRRVLGRSSHHQIGID